MLIHNLIHYISPSKSNYKHFLGSVKSAAMQHIPRGLRKTYISAWDENCSELLKEFKTKPDHNTADNLK